jgi:hypothetical protein
MTLKWGDPDIYDMTSTHEGGPHGDVDSLYGFYRLLLGTHEGETVNAAVRIEGKVIGITFTRHGEMGESV